MTTYSKIYKHQKGSCFYCNEKTDFNLMEKEHVFPRSEGGKGIKNKVLSCHYCNKIKSNFTISEFKVKVEGLLLLTKDIDKKTKLENILITLSKLENNPEIRKNFHKNAIYSVNNINEKPFKHEK